MVRDQGPGRPDGLDRAPEKILRNVKESYIRDSVTHEYVRAGARLVARIADPALSSADAVALVLGSRAGVLSTTKIVTEATKDDPDQHVVSRLEDRWPKMADYYADLLRFLLCAEQWGHHTSEASRELMSLAVKRKEGTDSRSAAAMINSVCDLDLKSYRKSSGYLLHLILAPTARRGGAVATAVRGMYKRVRQRWHAACLVAFKQFDVDLRPGVSMESFARALAVLADGVALQTISTGGDPNAAEDSDVDVMAEIAMMLLVGAVDVGKTGVCLTDAVNALTGSADEAA